MGILTEHAPICDVAQIQHLTRPGLEDGERSSFNLTPAAKPRLRNLNRPGLPVLGHVDWTSS
jgi:hypothetical protein